MKILLWSGQSLQKTIQARSPFKTLKIFKINHETMGTIIPSNFLFLNERIIKFSKLFPELIFNLISKQTCSQYKDGHEK